MIIKPQRRHQSISTARASQHMIPSMAGSQTYVGPAYYDSRQPVTSGVLLCYMSGIEVGSRICLLFHVDLLWGILFHELLICVPCHICSTGPSPMAVCRPLMRPHVLARGSIRTVLAAVCRPIIRFELVYQIELACLPRVPW